MLYALRVGSKAPRPWAGAALLIKQRCEKRMHFGCILHVFACVLHACCMYIAARRPTAPSLKDPLAASVSLWIDDVCMHTDARIRECAHMYNAHACAQGCESMDGGDCVHGVQGCA